MSCYNPSYVEKRYSLRTGELLTTKFIGAKMWEFMKQDFLMRDYCGNKSIDDHSYDIINGSVGSRIIQIPCGRCIGCRIDYKRSWADRLTYHSIGLEDTSWFVTLTYDDEHLLNLPKSNIPGVTSLDYDDLSDFIKSLRNKFRTAQIDFYGTGEYGTCEMRPHFHVILFNVPLVDLEFWKLNDHGDPIYTSNTLLDAWHSKGFITVSPFAWTNAAYTANYVEKKLNGALSSEYECYSLEPERSRCSRRPGIAHDYYCEHYESIWKNNGLNVGRDVNSSGHLGIPRYFRKLADEKGIGKDSYELYKQRSNDLINILNPLKVDNSSFDLSRVRELLQFEEREVLSSLSNKKI